MYLKSLVEGIQILRPYYNNPDGYNMGAEHDQFYMYATDKPLPETEVKRMVDLDWFQPDVVVPDGEDYSAKFYQPEEGWSAYV